MYRRNMTILVVAVVACWASASGFGQEQTKENTEPVLEYARDADTVVIMMDIYGDFSDDIPELRIYGDGRALVHRQTVGDYEMHLSSQEIDVWLRYLYDLGVLTFDRDAVKQTIFEIGMIRAAEAEASGQTEFTDTSRASVAPTTIEVRLNAFKPSGAGAQRVDKYSHRVVWNRPRGSADKFPDITELSDLADAAEALFDLTKHPDLVRIDEE